MRKGKKIMEKSLLQKVIRKAKKLGIFVLVTDSQCEFFSQTTGKFLGRWSSHQKTLFIQNSKISVDCPLSAVQHVAEKN